MGACESAESKQDWAATSTCPPAPVRERCWRASGETAAAYPPAQAEAWGREILSGGPSGSPVSDMQPAAAMSSRSEARYWLYGPVWPNGVIDVTMSTGFCSASVVYPSPRRSRWPGEKDSIRKSASRASRCRASRPAGSSRSSVTERLPAFQAVHERLVSGPGLSPGKGPRHRAGSPAGGSTLITSAPRSARILAQRGPSSPERSSTRYGPRTRSEEHTSELQSLAYLECRLLLEKKNLFSRAQRHTD